MAEPNRAADDQNLGLKDLPADRRPLVAVSLIGGDARLHVVISHADEFHVDLMLGQLEPNLRQEELATRRGRRALEGSVEQNGFHVPALS